MKQKQIIIIAGPNGAGKTTFAREFLPNEAGCPIFINADLIAAGFSNLWWKYDNSGDEPKLIDQGANS